MSRLKFFIELSASEDAMFRHWAREHYVPFSLINGTWHWVTQDECVQINRRTLSTTFQLPQSPIEPETGIQNEPPVESESPVKRGPGRPRKIQPASPEKSAQPVDNGPRITDRRGAGRIIGRSVSSIIRMEKHDPDWPKPIAVGSIHKCSYLIADIDAYIDKQKANAAVPDQAPKEAQIRSRKNLIPGYPPKKRR